MKTNLAYVDTAVSDALNREEKEPVIPTSALKKIDLVHHSIVAGIAIADDDGARIALALAKEERRQSISKFAEDRIDVQQKLKELNIEPLAVWPKAAWERLCADSGLYRLAPDAQGMVATNLNSLHAKAVTRAESITWKVYLALHLAYALVGAIVVAFMTHNPVLIAGGGGIGLVTGTCTSVVYCLMLQDILQDMWKVPLIKDVVTNYVLKSYDRMTHAEFLHACFPNGTTSVKDDDWRNNEKGNMMLRIHLPTPPIEVSRILARAKQLDLQVAAEAGAVGFALTPSQALRNMEAKRQELIREMLEWDPIVYHEHGSAVAIIAQYGDFPLEKEVVDIVVNSEHLL